ncbi:MAG: type II toxin-antitoxin system RelE/ParE family toxin [Proteobacteria bacterium]|nr:type II toxin-antitoxin system RelE/ParE family toxin [Pseudomonadota bacterium]
MKKFEFISAAAKRAYLALPEDIQKQFGTDLNAVQQGYDPFSTHKVLTESVGPGAIELIENGSPAYRAVYCVKYLDTVFVLHAFEKTTNGVDQKEMDTAAKRYKEMKTRVDAERKREKANARRRK